jgi:sugar O-acyltransferase (sialic acid O-acetyltransferase NeuD family)
MNSPTPKPIYIPLLNPNEREAHLVAIDVEEGDHVEVGQVICTLETTKSTNEITAEFAGYIVGLRFKESQTVSAGDIFCYLSDSPEKLPIKISSANIGSEYEGTHKDSSTSEMPVGLRITKPALALAEQNKLDLSQLPIGPLITEEKVQNLLRESTQQKSVAVFKNDFDPTSIIIYGGGGHGKTLIELIQAMSTYQIVGILDDGIDKNTNILNYPVLGGNEMLPVLYSSGVRLSVNAVGGVGDNSIRIEVFQRLNKAGFVCPPVVHPTAYIERSAIVSPGVQVFAHAYLGSEVKIGFGVIVNTTAIISHGCTIGDYAHISPGAILAGDVLIGNDVLVGMGATINLGVEIGDGARIGNGATVKQDVPENSIVQAGTIWPR